MENAENLEEWRHHPIGIWVSSKGRVISKRNGVNFGCNHRKGYKVVRWQEKMYRVHRLIAECFLDNPNNFPMVNHKDENKRNNCVENLEWCDAKYNLNYGNAQAKRVERKSIPVIQFDKQGNFIREWESATIAAREMGYHISSINSCCKGKLKSSNGFIWKYKDIA